MRSTSEFRTPPGPPLPSLVSGAVYLSGRQAPMRAIQGRYGDAFTLKLPGYGRSVVVAEPGLVKQVFTAPAEVLHAGEQNPLKALLGQGSLFAMDEDRHLRERRLLLPPFHGERMHEYARIFEEEAQAAIAGWPVGERFRTLESLSQVTLNAILRAVFGAEGQELAGLRRVLPPLTVLGSRLAFAQFLRRDYGRWSPWARFLRHRREYDRHVMSLIARARRDPALQDRVDVLSLLLQATYEDGTPISDGDVADELLTILTAGHETTASTLAWAVERLRRHPAILRQLMEEAREGGRELREATIRELQRSRPVINGTGRTVMRPFELGSWLLPPGTLIMIGTRLLHEDPRFYDDPQAFDPARFLDRKPDTYAWVPFGGGRRRCIGASFAHMELDIVLRTILTDVELAPTTDRDERWAFRGVAFAPGRGGQAVVRRRLTTTAATPAPAEAVAA